MILKNDVEERLKYNQTLKIIFRHVKDFFVAYNQLKDEHKQNKKTLTTQSHTRLTMEDYIPENAVKTSPNFF